MGDNLVRKCDGSCQHFHKCDLDFSCDYALEYQLGDSLVDVSQGDSCKYDLLSFAVSRPYGGRDWG